MGWSLATKALRLSPRQWRLIGEGWVELARVRWALRRQPLPALLAGIDRLPAAPHPPAEPLELAAAVWRASRLHPVPMLCLPRSLALARMMARRGEPCEVVIGAQPLNGTLDAHAWVEQGGTPLNSAADSAARHPVLIRHVVGSP